MSKKILIVGGGIIGICSAYYLSKSGHDVTIIDKYGMNSGASYCLLYTSDAADD